VKKKIGHDSVHESEWRERECVRNRSGCSAQLSLTHTCEHDIITITILTSAVYIRAEEAHTHTHTHTDSGIIMKGLITGFCALLLLSSSSLAQVHTHTHSVVIVMTVS